MNEILFELQRLHYLAIFEDIYEEDMETLNKIERLLKSFNETIEKKKHHILEDILDFDYEDL